MIDRPVDALLLTLQVLARPFSRVVFGAMGATTAPWTWSD
jgi:hypothetical protein